MDDKCLKSSRDNNDTINQSDVNRFKTNKINDPSEKSDNMDSEKEIKLETETNQSGGDAENNEYRKNSGFSFTIDFSGGKTVDNRKLKEMTERFQSRQQRQQEQRRHRRGVSLSKLNDISIETSKRHSWSPCSTQDRFINTSDQNFEHNETICAEIELKSPNKFQPKSTTLRSAMQNISLGTTTAMEIKERPQSEYKTTTVKQKYDEELIKTPLEYIRSSDDEGSIGLVSEAGTYTVDGDNYTEEEKERMSIDAMGKKRFELPIDTHNFNDNLNTFQANYGRVESTKATTKCSENRKLILKKEPIVKSPKTSVKFGPVCYIDKSKIQVKGSVAHPTKKNDRSESDHGVFTSITVCGVLDMQNGRKPSPKLPSRKCRRNSLTKLQIDSSEYIQPKIIPNSSYTDYEKAQHNEYQLNIFSNTSSYTSLASTPQTDDEILSVECIENMSNSIKTAQTKNDWIQEWAKNARRRNTLLSTSLSNTLPEQDSMTNVCSPRQIERIKQTRDRRMTQSYDVSYTNHGDASQSSDIDCHDRKIVPNNISRPPISPTKIPSPRHTQHRVRSSSANRMLYNTDFHNFDVEKYIAKTTSSKQKHLARTNSPDSLISPNAHHGSPPLNSSALILNNNESPQMRNHKRNLSLDISNKVNSKTNPIEMIDNLPKRHSRQNSYELNSMNIDQTISSHNNTKTTNRKESHTHQQIPYEKKIYGNATTSTAVATGISYKRLINRNSKPSMNASPKSNDRTSDYRQSDSSPCSSLYKSNESEVYHINANDDLRISNDDILSSPDTDDNPKNDRDKNTNNIINQISSSEKILSNTRYNKAFRMRMEQNKQITGTNQGVSACPNTPEMTRRSSKARSSFRDTTSMPRDSSLTRLKTELQNFQTTKKNLHQPPTPKPTVTTTVSNNIIKQRIQPKYLDISKYKPVQGQSFLKRDESKSTLVNRSEMKKSPSAVGLSRNDTARSSIRVKSAGAKPSTPTSTRDSKSREQELLMWRRRATYDPMKAAAEGKKKQLQEAKKSVQKSGLLNSGNSAVLRSQSFHNGTMQFGDFQLRQQFSEDSLNRIHWTMNSTESSEEEEFGDNE